MKPPYDRLRKLARQIVSRYPTPDFYGVHARSHRLSQQIFFGHPIVLKLRRHLTTRLDDDFGHGLAHATAVALDAGSLLAIEAARHGLDERAMADQIVLVHSAGLLHDIQRKKKNHASRGAQAARQTLEAYPFSSAEIEDICLAIRNHEAFQPTCRVETPEGRLISDCLYDADKFRWGPDNFTDTLWEMVAFYSPTLSGFMAQYPKGMAALTRIKSTFRTVAGKVYGPQFIELGIAIGRELHAAIAAEFADEL